MNDHDSMPIGRDDRPRVVLLRLLAGGMSALLFSVAGYIYVSVPPEWSFDYIASLAITPWSGLILLRNAVHGDRGRDPDQITPSTPEPAASLHPADRVIVGIVGLFLLFLFVAIDFRDWRENDSGIFSTLPLLLVIPAIFIARAVTGRKDVLAGFAERNWTIFLVAFGLFTIFDAILEGELSSLGIGFSVVCYFLYLTMRLRSAKPVLGSRA